MPKTVDTRSHCKEHATIFRNPLLHLGLRKSVVCSQPYLAVTSCIYSFWHSVIPTNSLIYTHCELLSYLVNIARVPADLPVDEIAKAASGAVASVLTAPQESMSQAARDWESEQDDINDFSARSQKEEDYQRELCTLHSSLGF